MANQTEHTIENGYVIVRCPEGHLNKAQKVADITGEKTLVCANVRCSREWSQIVPRIGELEEHEA